MINEKVPLQVTSGVLTAGDLSAFVLYSLFLGFQTSSLATTWADVQRALGASERVMALAERRSAMAPSATHPEAAAEAEARAAAAAEAGGLTFDRVSFTYPARPDVLILEDFSLSVAPGEVRKGAGIPIVLLANMCRFIFYFIFLLFLVF